jgi:hypothetical protein
MDEVQRLQTEIQDLNLQIQALQTAIAQQKNGIAQLLAAKHATLLAMCNKVISDASQVLNSNPEVNVPSEVSAEIEIKSITATLTSSISSLATKASYL